jgi:glycosyltransferase involved in cell wall biosynthesis
LFTSGDAAAFTSIYLPWGVVVIVGHLVPHVGGGVGSVIRTLIESTKRSICHQLFCLETCQDNFDAIDVKTKFQGLYLEHNYKKKLVKKLGLCDRVLVHYWNHPLLADLLFSDHFANLDPVFWCHNSGLFEPYVIPDHLCEVANKILFTSSCSYQAKNLRRLTRLYPNRFDAIHSVCDLSGFVGIANRRIIAPIANSLLYVGTVSPAKLHPSAANIFAELSQNGFDVTVVGGPDHRLLSDRVTQLGGRINVVGKVTNVTSYLEAADAFLYPLSSRHFGTGEQAMLEALASGLPVIAFDNPAETCILKNRSGLLVSNATDFVKTVKDLRTNVCFRNEICETAATTIKSRFDHNLMCDQLISHLSTLESTIRSGPISRLLDETRSEDRALKIYALQSFHCSDFVDQVLQARGADLINVIMDNIRSSGQPLSVWTSSSKSSPFQYQSFFQTSESLNLLCTRLGRLINSI